MSIESIAICLHHSRAAKTEKLVLLGIANHDGDGGAWPSVATLARYANCSERHVQRAIQSLVELGEIRVVDQAGGNDETRRDRRPNLYKVLVRCPADCDGSSQHRTRGDADGTPSNGVTESTERGDISDADGVTPVSPEPSLEPSKKPLADKPPESSTKKKDNLFETVAEVCGISLTGMTRSSRGQLNKAVKELRDIHATDEQVRHKAKAYKAQYPNATLTPTALIKHWSSFAELEKKQQRPSIWETYEPPEYY
ncbi:MAG TPA: helix-turn-helix domain-containing protein [Acidimicrobiia bacterium]